VPNSPPVSIAFTQIFGEEYMPWSSLYSFLVSCYFLPTGLKHLPQHPILQLPKAYVFPLIWPTKFHIHIYRRNYNHVHFNIHVHQEQTEHRVLWTTGSKHSLNLTRSLYVFTHAMVLLNPSTCNTTSTVHISISRCCEVCILVSARVAKWQRLTRNKGFKRRPPLLGTITQRD
jgi:hypothetical protein